MRGIRTETTFKGEALGALTQAAADAFVTRVSAWQPPPSMSYKALGAAVGPVGR
jgi:hypothetical protein